jgi:CRP-like cAMP-binding protein
MRRALRQATGNALLDSLPAQELAGILPRASLVALKSEETLFRPGGRRLSCVYFPVDAVISLVQVMDDGAELEFNSVGRHGISGSRSVLGSYGPTRNAVCSISGRAYRVPMDEFLELAAPSSMLLQKTLRYNAAVMNIVAQYSACNQFHDPSERCARWLLIAHDHTQRYAFAITHYFLARLLGLHRPGLSLAVSRLKRRGAIDVQRGQIAIRDRERLLAASCECYRKISPTSRFYKREVIASPRSLMSSLARKRFDM